MRLMTLMKLGTLIVAACLALLVGWGAGDLPPALPVLSGPYLGQTPPGDRALLFAPGTVSTGHFEHSSPVFTPDLKEIYWSVQIADESGRDTAKPILFMKETGGRWSRPEVAPFAKAFACAESPFVEPGGKRIFFHAGPALRSEQMFLYRVPRDGDGWGVPVKLAPPLNERHLNGQPAVAANGTIYFAGDHRGDIGLYSARKIPGAAANAPGNGNGDVYWIDAGIIGKLRATGEAR